MAIYQGNGYLVGVNTYTKDKVTKINYSVINGSIDPQTKLFDDIELKVCTEEKVKINNPKFMQPVKYKINIKSFGDKTYSTLFDIESA